MYACIVHYSYIYLSSCQSWSKGSVPRNYPKFKCWTIFLGSIDAISPFIYSRMVGDPQSHTAAAFSAQRILRTVFGKTDAAKFLVQHSQVEARSSSKSWADDMLWLADESLPFQKQKKSRLLRHEPQYPKPLPGEWGLVLDMTTTFCWSQLVQFCTSVRWVENTGEKTIDKWWYNMV